MLADRCDVADNLITRGLGLIPRSRLGAGEGLLLTKTGSITMWFMRFGIDAIFVDRDRRVVKVAADLPPWRFAVFVKGARDVFEVPAGTAARTGTQAGDELLLEPVS